MRAAIAEWDPQVVIFELALPPWPRNLTHPEGNRRGRCLSGDAARRAWGDTNARCKPPPDRLDGAYAYTTKVKSRPGPSSPRHLLSRADRETEARFASPCDLRVKLYWRAPELMSDAYFTDMAMVGYRASSDNHREKYLHRRGPSYEAPASICRSNDVYERPKGARPARARAWAVGRVGLGITGRQREAAEKLAILTVLGFVRDRDARIYAAWEAWRV